MKAEHVGKTVVFFDGVCGMCNRLVRFLMRNDRDGVLLYAALQSEMAKERVLPHGVDPAELDTFVLLTGYGTAEERVHLRSRAAFEVFRIIGGIYTPLSWLRVLPAGLTDLGYRLIARFRYRIFGKYDACPIPSPEERAKILAV
ncbi:MAG: DCC1-like thiol-disulfide oxidoreductase family protein [Myxococcota bacterium]